MTFKDTFLVSTGSDLLVIARSLVNHYFQWFGAISKKGPGQVSCANGRNQSFAIMELGSAIGFGQLGAFIAIGYFVVKKFGADLSSIDKFTAIWFIFDGLCHLIFEGAYVLFTVFGTVKASNALLALPCTYK